MSSKSLALKRNQKKSLSRKVKLNPNSCQVSENEEEEMLHSHEEIETDPAGASHGSDLSLPKTPTNGLEDDVKLNSTTLLPEPHRWPDFVQILLENRA